MDRPTADDSVDNRALIKNYLKKETEPRLYFAANGQAAFDICKRRIFSLLLMDMEMAGHGWLYCHDRYTTVRTCEEDSCNSYDSPSGNDRNQ